MRLLLTGRAVRAAQGARLAIASSQVPDHHSYGHGDAGREKRHHSFLPPRSAFYSTQPTPAQASDSSGGDLQTQYPDTQTRRRATDPPQQKVRTSTSSRPSPNQPAPPDSDFEQQLLEANEPNKIISLWGQKGVVISSKPYALDKVSNLPPSILALLNRNLYSNPRHPLCITRKLIESVFATPTFVNLTASNPVVSTVDNFDALGFPHDHPGRSRTDTYYVNSDHVLRTHTSAHQLAAFSAMRSNDSSGQSGYTICADVFRRDSIDRSHFPAFHQMEGARLWDLPLPLENKRGLKFNRYDSIRQRLTQMQEDVDALPNFDIVVEDPSPLYHQESNPPQSRHDHEEIRLMTAHLKKSLIGLVAKVFEAAREAGLASGEEPKEKEPLKVRWVEAYFPFVSPGWELEVYWQGEWLELLGSGIVQQKLLDDAGVGNRIGWAWGLGVERLAMVLFGIPDIRLFWSQDERFLKQFRGGKVTRYEPFSKYPACYKDVAFWINSTPAAASPLLAAQESRASSGVASAAGGDATKASPTENMPTAFHENDVMEIVRDVAGSLAEDVKLVDEFLHPRTARKSLCYRINYRSLERTLTNEEVNDMHGEVVARLASELEIELR